MCLVRTDAARAEAPTTPRTTHKQWTALAAHEQRSGHGGRRAHRDGRRRADRVRPACAAREPVRAPACRHLRAVWSAASSPQPAPVRERRGAVTVQLPTGCRTYSAAAANVRAHAPDERGRPRPGGGPVAVLLAWRLKVEKPQLSGGLRRAPEAAAHFHDVQAALWGACQRPEPQEAPGGRMGRCPQTGAGHLQPAALLMPATISQSMSESSSVSVCSSISRSTILPPSRHWCFCRIALRVR